MDRVWRRGVRGQRSGVRGQYTVVRGQESGKGVAKKIIILGATGSIGRNAIDVALSHPDEFKVDIQLAHSAAEGRRSAAWNL